MRSASFRAELEGYHDGRLLLRRAIKVRLRSGDRDSEAAIAA
jgi:hypothetical protein